ncbi:MAG: hypothetical protein Q9227_003739 [Pyrenula ochraceoflavens]
MNNNTLSFPQNQPAARPFPGNQQPNAFQQGNRPPSLDQHIISNLQKQEPLSGWQASVSAHERLILIRQLIDSLRLIRPPVSVNNAIQVAISFEHRALVESADKTAYKQECATKLAKIRETREKQAATMQQQHPGMQNPMHQTPSSQPQNLGFPPQLQHPMQASPIPNMPHQNGMNINPNMNMDGMMGGLGGNPQQRNPGMQGQQRPNGVPQTQQQQRPGAGPMAGHQPLTPQEHMIVNNMAASIARAMSEDQKNAIRAKMRSSNPRFDQTGQDPIDFFCKTQAVKNYRQQKMQHLAQTHGISQPNPQVPNGAQPSQAGPNQSQRPNNMNMGNMQGAPHPTVMGSVNHFQGQQADGLRSQEAGQLVVPASNPQGYSMQQPMMRNGQTPATRPMTNQNMMATQPQQQNMQPFQQMQPNQSAFPTQQNLRGTPMRNSMGPQGQQPSSQPQNPMGMLNQSAPSQNQSMPNRAPSAQRQVPPSPAIGHQGSPQQAPNGPKLSAGVQQALMSVPQEFRAAILRSPPDQWAQLIARFRNSGAGAAQAPQMQQTTSQPGQARPPTGGRFAVEGDNGPQPMQQSLSAGPITNQRPNQNITPQMLADQQRLRQQNSEEMLRQGQQPAGRPIPALTKQEMDRMDTVDFPPQLRQTAPEIPPNISKWFELKQWFTANPIPSLSLPKLNSLQAVQYHKWQERQRVPPNGPPGGLSQNNTGQAGQTARGMGQQAVTQIPGQNQSNIPINMRNPPQISPQAIQQARNTYPQFQGKSDLEVAGALQRHRLQREIASRQGQRSNAPGGNLPAGAAPSAQSQQQDQAARSQPAGQAGISRPTMDQQRQQQMSQMQRPPSAMSGNQRGDGQAQKGTPQLPTAQQSTKNLKRSSDDITDKGQIPNAGIPVQQQQGAVHVTQDQWNKMSPEQQQEYLRRRQAPRAAMADPSFSQPDPEAARQFHALWNETVATTKKPPVVAMSSSDRQRFNQILRHDKTLGMLKRVQPFMSKYFQHTGDKAGVIEVLRSRLYITWQMKTGSIPNVPEPTDHPTLTVPQLEHHYHVIELRFSEAMKTVQAKIGQVHPQVPGPGKAGVQLPQGSQAQMQANNQSQAQLKGQVQTQAQGQPANKVSQTQNTNAHLPQQPLSAENLLQLEQQQEAQREKKAGRVTNQTSGPTPNNGQGTPIYGTQGGVTQDNLKLPDIKRRKKNSQGTAPTTPQKPSASPQLQRKGAETSKFKCNVEGCEYSDKGFNSQNELESHRDQAHRKEEQIEDPLAYMMDNARTALGLDERGQSLNKAAKEEYTKPQAPSMARTASKEPSIKQPNSTPMSREVSKAGVKANTPTVNTKSSQALIKGAAHIPTAKDKHGPSAGTLKKPQEVPQKPTPDPWSESPVSLSALQDTFGDFKMEPHFDDTNEWCAGFPMDTDVDEMMSAFVESDAWTKIQAPAQQPSSTSSADGASSDQTKLSPAQNSDSDISKSDDLYINIDPQVPLGEDFHWEDLLNDVDDSGDVVMTDGAQAPKGEEEIVFDGFNLDELNGNEDESWKDTDWDQIVENFAVEEAKKAEEEAKWRGRR